MTLKLPLTSTLLVTAATTFTLSFLGSDAQAAIITGNMPDGNGNTTLGEWTADFNIQSNDSGIAGDQSKSITFTMGNIAQTLDSIRLYAGGVDTGEILMQIYEEGRPVNGTATLNPFDSANLVGTFGGPTGSITAINPPPDTVSNPPFGTLTSVFTLTPLDEIILEADTTYSLLLTTATGTAYNWKRDNPSNPTAHSSDIGVTVDGYNFFDGGSPTNPTWSSSGIFNNIEFNGSEFIPPVPEPSSIVGLLALGLFGGASALKNRKKN